MEELEDVSLCDLPLLNTKPKKQPQNDGVFHSPEDFAFGFEAGEMCVADEVFFQGRILPLQLDPSKKLTRPVTITRVSSDPTSYSYSTNPNRLKNLTQTGSTNPNPLTGLTSRNTTRAEPGSATRVSFESRIRTRNQFQTHPSPKPHVRASSASYYRENSSIARLERARSVKTKQKSSVWDFFRSGLVRTPEIEIQEIRANILRRSSSCQVPGKPRAPASEGSANSSDEWKKTMFLSGSCKCSAVDSDAIVAKSKGNGNGNNGHGDERNNGVRSEKVRLLTEAKNGVVLSDWSENRDERKEKKKSSRKQAHVLNHRTCEWLKQLSHANLAMPV